MRRIESAIASKNLDFRLFWVQGHLDTVAPVGDFPAIFVAANLAADVFADKAAHRCQLSPSTTTEVLLRTKLVKRIQLRLARIVISHVEKSSFEQRPTTNRPKQASIHECIELSSHHLVEEASGWRCLICHSRVSKNAQSLRVWLASACMPIVRNLSDKCDEHPSWFPIQVGSSIIHSSHTVRSYRGIFFCTQCGHFGAQKLVCLARQCNMHTTKASQKHLDSLMRLELPTKSMVWPLSQPTR